MNVFGSSPRSSAVKSGTLGLTESELLTVYGVYRTRPPRKSAARTSRKDCTIDT